VGECRNQTYNRKQATEVLVKVPFILKAPKCYAVREYTPELENSWQQLASWGEVTTFGSSRVPTGRSPAHPLPAPDCLCGLCLLDLSPVSWAGAAKLFCKTPGQSFRCHACVTLVWGCVVLCWPGMAKAWWYWSAPSQALSPRMLGPEQHHYHLP